jgi:hypothetical protein
MPALGVALSAKAKPDNHVALAQTARLDPKKKSWVATERNKAAHDEFKAQQANLKVDELEVLDEYGCAGYQSHPGV